ncbi:MAG: inorganic phosphate transporter [Gammaproteobacteria bacterium]
MTSIWLLIVIILFALAFDFLNGFHDAANSIATVVSTRVLKPHWAVVWAAFFNFVAFLFFKLNVATTIGTGLVDPHIITPTLILAALLGATLWDLLTWFVSLPTSSSHALIGGLVGAGIARAGWHILNIGGLTKVGVSIILSPLMGMILGMVLIFIVVRIFFNSSPQRVDHWFRRLQLLSSAFISLGHGGNDAQKTMGIIAVLLFSTGHLGKHFYVPFWVIVSCNLVIALGTLFGGWRIVKTMGMRITKLKPVSGFCAETASALTLSLATILGIPVSTTHTITGAVVGVGSALNGTSAVRWGIARRIVWAWIFTIPAAGILAAIIWHFLKLLGI